MLSIFGGHPHILVGVLFDSRAGLLQRLLGGLQLAA